MHSGLNKSRKKGKFRESSRPLFASKAYLKLNVSLKFIQTELGPEN